MIDPAHPIAELLKRDSRYKFDAYVFVFESLKYAQEVLGMGTEQASHSSDQDNEETSAEKSTRSERHLTGQDLCEAIRLYALEQYGYLAKDVLNHWGVQATSDFGEIVFNLIDIGQMRKTNEDRREDFENIFSFDEGLRQSFQIKLPD